jgi:hypothetical protein
MYRYKVRCRKKGTQLWEDWTGTFKDAKEAVARLEEAWKEEPYPDLEFGLWVYSPRVRIKGEYFSVYSGRATWALLGMMKKNKEKQNVA